MQVDLDVTVSAIAETATASGIWKITALPTAGVDSTKPGELTLNLTNGIQIFFTATTGTGGGLVAEKIFPVGRRFVARLHLLGP